jgi:hypothetical protein
MPRDGAGARFGSAFPFHDSKTSGVRGRLTGRAVKKSLGPREHTELLAPLFLGWTTDARTRSQCRDALAGNA